MYFYHAHAVALGGVRESPVSQIIEAQAACALPISGGKSSASTGKFDFDNGLISFDSAQSSLLGRAERKNGNDVYYTEVSITINNLNVGNRFMADRVITQIASEHKIPVGQVPPDDSEPEIITTGSHFENLRIAGHPVTLETCHDVFCDLSTYKSCQADWQRQDASRLRKTLMGSTLDSVPKPDDPEHLHTVHDGFVAQRDSTDLRRTVLCSFVKKVKGIEGSEIKNCDSIIRIPQWGTIYLGEVIISHGYRRVNMFRLQLGSPQQGGFVGGGGGSNGTTYP
jgi:hypothetical protein